MSYIEEELSSLLFTMADLSLAYRKIYLFFFLFEIVLHIHSIMFSVPTIAITLRNKRNELCYHNASQPLIGRNVNVRPQIMDSSQHNCDIINQ